MSELIASKALGPMEIGDEAKGEVTAVVSTLDVVDRDKEVILRDAFPSGVKVKLSGYGHSSILSHMAGSGIPEESPVGKGVIVVEGDRAIFRGNYFLSTSRGREAFATTKEMGPDQEWSHTFHILKAEQPSEEWRAKGARRVFASIMPFEVSPITVGGGVGTRTLGTKQLDTETAAMKEAIAGAIAGKMSSPFPFGSHDACVMRLGMEASVGDPEQLCTDWAQSCEKELAELAAAEAKALADVAAAESKAAADLATAQAKALARLRMIAEEEFERFQRNLRRYHVA